MQTKGPGAFVTTVIVVAIVFLLLAVGVGADTWIGLLFREFISALKESTDFRPEKYFRRVSLYGEVRAQLEVLGSNRYLQLYFLCSLLTAGVSYIFVKKEMPVYNRRNRAMLVALLLLMMLPMSVATVTYGKVFAALATKVISVTILVLMGLFVTTEMLRVKPQGIMSRLFHLLVLLLVFAQGVAVPGLYGWLVIFRNS
mgnify:CR=1 FL=1